MFGQVASDLREPMTTSLTSAIQHTRDDREIAAIVRAAASGDDNAWNELVTRFDGMLWSVTRRHRLSAADGADVVQSTWLQLVRHLGNLKNSAAVGAWLTTTARRECLRIRIASQHLIPYGDDLPEPPAHAASIDEELLRSESGAALRQAITCLRPRDRALVHMLANDPPPSYGEISDALDIPVGSIGPTRARCFARLRVQCAQLRPGLG
jgi:RNA polymerase sigma factor (sigma-70 family)